MRGIIYSIVHNPIVADLMAISIIGAGIVFGSRIRREFFPEVRPNEVVVAAPYPGASPSEIEGSLALKIEDSLRDLNDVKEVNTTATQDAASIRIEFEEGVEIGEAVADVKRRVDALQDLPEESERIVVTKLEPNIPVIALSLAGDADERVMKRAIREMRSDLEGLPGMGQVMVSGVRDDEVTVEVRPGELVKHGMSVTAVAEAVRRAMAEIPGGSVRSGSANVTVRTLGAEDRAAAVRGIVVKTYDDGAVVRLDEIADVSAGFADVSLRTRLNGKPCVSLTVFKVSDQDAIDIAEMVKAYVAGRRGEDLRLTRLEWLRGVMSSGRSGEPVSARVAAYELGLSRVTPPPGEMVLHTDLSRIISDRLSLLSRNAMQGTVLVFLVLLLFLHLRDALWVTVGLVTAVLGALAAMYLLGVTLNLLSMFGLIIVLGMLVDDAIVVAENITTRFEAGEAALSAAVNGAVEVGWPVTASVLTNIWAFMSLVLIQGQMGDLLAQLPVVVSIALGVSLFESLFILPAHMGHSLKRAERRKGARRRAVSRMMARADGWRESFMRRGLLPGYSRVLRWALGAPYLSTAVAVSLFIGSVGMVAGGRLPFTFFGVDDAETLVADIRMPIGTPLSKTEEIVRKIEAAATGQREVVTALALVGTQSSMDGGESTSQEHLAQVWVELVPADDRDRTSNEVKEAIRAAAGDLTGIKSLRISSVQGGPSGPTLAYTVTSDTPATIDRVVERIEALMSPIEGVYDVATDADVGQRELQLTLRPGANELGLTTDALARQVRGWVIGLEAKTFAAPDEDVDVRVMLPESYRRSLASIGSMQVLTAAGVAVPLGEVAEIREATSNATIRRLDRRRAVTVSAEVNDLVTNPELVSSTLWPSFEALMREHPGVRIVPRGRQKELTDSLSTLPLGMLVSSGLIYVTLAWIFRSYAQPLLVMTAIPFGLIGMIWGHIIMGYPLTLLSLIGFVALSGVVINDSIIIMDFYNAKRREGVPAIEAAYASGRERLRAVLLTTLTTCFGLAPLMLETSFQARFLIPMAISICFGLAFGTVITLLAIPCFLIISEDIRAWWRIAWRGAAADEGSAGSGPASAGEAV